MVSTKWLSTFGIGVFLLGGIATAQQVPGTTINASPNGYGGWSYGGTPMGSQGVAPNNAPQPGATSASGTTLQPGAPNAPSTTAQPGTTAPSVGAPLGSSTTQFGTLPTETAPSPRTGISVPGMPSLGAPSRGGVGGTPGSIGGVRGAGAGGAGAGGIGR
jgi:hypothetical protein